MAKQKEKNLTSTKVKSRAKYQCPPELEEMIKLANLMPPNLPAIDEVWEEAVKLPKHQSSEDDYALKLQLVTDFCLKDLPKELQDYIDDRAFNRTININGHELKSRLLMSSSYRYQAIAQIYEEIRNLQISMLQLVIELNDERELNERIEKFGGSSSHEREFHVSLSSTIIRDADGNLRVTGLANLIGKFDESRLRQCKICHRFFWAKRKQSKACKLKCANTLRVRDSRTLTDAQKADRKAKREANQELIKNGKAKLTKRKNKDGTL